MAVSLSLFLIFLICHSPVEVPGEETHNEWLEAVTDDVYGSLPQDEENA